MNQTFTVGAYGKLGLSKEYLRHNCHDGIALRLRNWMDTGFDRAAATGRLPAQNGVVYRLLFSPPGDSHVLVAVLKHSVDASGYRAFPFALFASAPRPRVLAGDFLQRLEPVWAKLESEFAALVKTATNDEFFGRLRLLAVSGVLDESGESAPFTQFLATPTRDWLEGMYRQDPADLWVRGLWRLHVQREPLNRESGPAPSVAAANAQPALRAFLLPLSSKEAPTAQVDLWRAILASAHAQLQQLPTVFLPTVFLPGVSSASATLIYRDLRAEDLPNALGCAPTNGQLTDLVSNDGKLPAQGLGVFRDRVEAGPLASGAVLRRVLEFKIAP
ncbi:MAG: hypothetical protein ACKVX7_12920 [Planctomycetota bacterium]